MSAVEHWIVQKTEELRSQHDALSLAQRERAAAVARADALSRELAQTSTNLEALNGRERALAEALTSEQEAAQRRVAELEAARGDAARLAQELADAHAAETRHHAALAASGTLLEERSGELQALHRTHEALLADQERAARELSEFEIRLRDSEARERNAQRTIETQNHTLRELTQRAQHETGAREHLAAEVQALRAQLANCIESLHSRESYRAIYESTLQELDAELGSARLRTAEQEARANQLSAELQSRDRGLQSAVRERDEARHLHDTEITQRAAERGEDERRRGTLESRIAELTAEHSNAHARLLSMEAALTAAQRRADAEALANEAATERLRELGSAVTSREAELTSARLEIECNRALLADLTAALLKSQIMFADQGRLLEELTARLAAPEAARRALEERAAALTKEAAESDLRLTRLESMNSALRATVGQLNTSLAERDAELQRTTQIASTNAYALGRVQSSIDELGRALIASEGASIQAQVSILTRIDRGQNHSVVLRGRATIGRDLDNDLSLAMRSVSRHHAVLIPAFRTAFVQDLRSTNGVLVNKRRVRCARLEHGDVVAFGEAEFRYTVTPAPAGAASIGSTTSGSTRAPLRHAP